MSGVTTNVEPSNPATNVEPSDHATYVGFPDLEAKLYGGAPGTLTRKCAYLYRFWLAMRRYGNTLTRDQALDILRRDCGVNAQYSGWLLTPQAGGKLWGYRRSGGVTTHVELMPANEVCRQFGAQNTRQERPAAALLEGGKAWNRHLTLQHIRLYCGDKGGVVLAQRDLARSRGISMRALQYHLRDLRANGEVKCRNTWWRRCEQPRSGPERRCTISMVGVHRPGWWRRGPNKLKVAGSRGGVRRSPWHQKARGARRIMTNSKGVYLDGNVSKRRRPAPK